MSNSLSFTRRDILLLLAAGGIQSQAARRLQGATGLVSSSLPYRPASEVSQPDLERLARSPLVVEFPGGEPHMLTPGAPRRILGVEITEFPKVGSLAIRQVVSSCGEGVFERSLEVVAEEDATFNLELRYEFPGAESFYSWMHQEEDRVTLVHDRLQSLKPGESAQLFPFAGAVEGGRLTGAISDTPGFWENRSQQVIDPGQRRILLRTGDGSPERVTSGTDDPNYLHLYHAEFDGWQHIRKSQLLQFRTWLFAATARDLYDVQLAAYRALAAAKGWGSSALTAILRSTAYFAIRRDLTRPESRYILTSGPNYGWHQWIATAAMGGLGLQDPEILAEAVRGLFPGRSSGEDQAQWYLIICALLARAGFHPNLAQCRRALEYMRDNEKNGAYVPPRGQGDPKNLGWKSYMDAFYYADGDAMTSNQGFHCGALVAAQELGFPVSDADVQRACTAYAGMFNHEGGYFPTSVMRPEAFGGDALYGEAVTFATFGKKSLPDDLVLKHCRHAMKIQTPYGIRWVSKANGDLLDPDQYGPKGGPPNPFVLPPYKGGRPGEFINGGSWFFCDAGTWLSGLAHGLDSNQVDSLLIDRIKVELAHKPSFSETVNTRTGEHFGNILYVDNGLYLWLRPTIRKRLGHTGPDPVDAAIEKYLRNRPHGASGA